MAPQNVGNLKARITDTEARVAELRAWIGALETYRAEAVKRAPAAEDHSYSATRSRAALEALEHGWDRTGDLMVGGEVGDGLLRGRPGLVRARTELPLLEESLELLRADLPSPEEFAEAEAEAEVLQGQRDRLAEQYVAAYSDLAEALVAVEDSARTVARLRGEHLHSAAALETHAKSWGIPAERARALEPPPGEHRLAVALKRLLEIVLHGGEPDGAINGAIRDARESLHPAEEAA